MTKKLEAIISIVMAESDHKCNVGGKLSLYVPLPASIPV